MTVLSVSLNLNLFLTTVYYIPLEMYWKFLNLKTENPNLSEFNLL